MLATELQAMTLADSVGEGADGAVRIIQLDVEEAKCKLARLRKTAMLLQTLESSPSQEEWFLGYRILWTLENRLGVQIDQFIALNRRSEPLEGQGHWAKQCPKRQTPENRGPAQAASGLPRTDSTANTTTNILVEQGSEVPDPDGFQPVRSRSGRNGNGKIIPDLFAVDPSANMFAVLEKVGMEIAQEPDVDKEGDLDVPERNVGNVGVDLGTRMARHNMGGTWSFPVEPTAFEGS
ncbi:hypothetical protein R1sor_011628 [Riccia sorocarpa]|uniref:Uncharacterized protein n=1 Tax=Riccia sorocarpa TaxID=122646 RepID=A0ABD3I451_9MARC